ncbi:hypothetical protein [Clostridium tertium]|uniref:DUF7852 domain-containing protein n=1 Tax=Clostridium tertium TaxID=1559 RepID=A0A6N3B3A5_9CLOT
MERIYNSRRNFNQLKRRQYDGNPSNQNMYYMYMRRYYEEYIRRQNNQYLYMKNYYEQIIKRQNNKYLTMKNYYEEYIKNQDKYYLYLKNHYEENNRISNDIIENERKYYINNTSQSEILSSFKDVNIKDNNEKVFEENYEEILEENNKEVVKDVEELLYEKKEEFCINDKKEAINEDNKEFIEQRDKEFLKEVNRELLEDNNEDSLKENNKKIIKDDSNFFCENNEKLIKKRSKELLQKNSKELLEEKEEGFLVEEDKASLEDNDEVCLEKSDKEFIEQRDNKFLGKVNKESLDEEYEVVVKERDYENNKITTEGIYINLPVILAEANITISIEDTIKIDGNIKEIKRIKMKVFLTQSHLIPFSASNTEPNTGVLFIKGIIKKDIEYETTNYNDLGKENDFGNMRYCTVEVPFNFTIRINFIRQPIFVENYTISEVRFLRNENQVCEINEDSVIGNDPYEQSFSSTEIFNEKPFVELVKATFLEININKNSIMNQEIDNEEGINKIKEKVIVNLMIRVLQNQQLKVEVEQDLN